MNSLENLFLWTTKLCFLVYLFSTTPLPVGWFKVSESALSVISQRPKVGNQSYISNTARSLYGLKSGEVSGAVSQETRRHEVSADGVRRVRSCLNWSLLAEMHVCRLCGSRQRHAGDNFTPRRLDITVYLTASYAVRTLKSTFLPFSSRFHNGFTLYLALLAVFFFFVTMKVGFLRTCNRWGAWHTS